MPHTIRVGDLVLGEGQPLVLIGGPCVIEDAEQTWRTAAALRAITATVGISLIFKSSFFKGNRTSLDSYTGPGMEEGLRILEGVKERFDLPVTTDVHIPSQAAAAAQVADLLQVPAFLSRQTDLLTACGATGRPVNIKKGQFLAPWDMRHAVLKVEASGTGGVMLTERGTTFGYNNLVVDMRGIVEMKRLEVPVCFDATHAVQLPGGRGEHSGGQRQFAAPLARAAVAVGVDAVFAEIHENPPSALCDRETQLPLAQLESFLRPLQALRQLSL